MSKNFFVIVPYGSSVAKKSITGFGKKQTTATSLESFEEERTQLDQRVGVVEQGLASIGLKTARLGTEEVVELLYKVFNPGESEKPIQIEKK